MRVSSTHPAGVVAMTEHAVVIAAGGPTGLMLASRVGVGGDRRRHRRAARQPRTSPGTRAGGLHARTIEVLDQRGVADRFLSEGQVAQVAGFAGVTLDISDFPTRHPYGLRAVAEAHRADPGWLGRRAAGDCLPRT